MATPGAFPRGVARVHLDHDDTSEKRLIQHKHFQLIKRPRVQDYSLPVPNFYPITDAAEILNGDPALGAFSRGYDLLRYYVIGVRGKALLFASEFLQATIRRSGSFLLKFAAQAALMMAHTLYLGAAVSFAIGISGDIGDPKVHTQEFVYLGGIGSIGVAGGRQIELAAMVEQIRFTLSVEKQHLLSRPTFETEASSSFHRPDRYGLLNNIPGENPVIVWERPVLAKDSRYFLVKFVSIRYFGNTADYHLGGQFEPFAGFVVDDLVERRLPELLRFPSLQADPIAGRVSGLKRLSNGLRSRANNDLDFGRQLHYTSIVEQSKLKVNRLKAVISDLEG